MNWPAVVTAMQALAERFQVAGCALVEPESGWVWHACGPQAQSDDVWESAVDYWRLHDRHRHSYAQIGELAAVVLYHRLGALAILPCSDAPRLHMICLAEHGRMDWIAWQRAVRGLADLLTTDAARV